jgi:hypothetical protein
MKKILCALILISVLFSSKHITIKAKANENQNFITAEHLSDNDYMTDLINDMIDGTNIDDIYGEYVYRDIDHPYRFDDGSYIYCSAIFRRTNELIKTPNGSDVNGENNYVLKYWGIVNSDNVKDIIESLNSGENVELEGNMDSRIVEDLALVYQKYFSNYDPTYNYLRSATAAYNCHSYAWYKQSDDNTIWLDSPEVYYSDADKSYRELDSTESPVIGDIIVYMNGNNPSHSGIITGYVSGATTDGKGGANMYVVESKWSHAGLYRHKGDECPYYKIDRNDFYVKYYRPQSDEQIDVTNGNLEYSITETISARTNNGVTSAEEKNFTAELNVTQDGNQTITVTSYAPLTTKLNDSNRQPYTDATLTETIENGLYTYTYTGDFDTGIYYLRSEFTSDSTDGQITITVAHNHGNYSYASQGASGHRVLCRCGYYYTAGHIAKGSVPGRYKPCVSCGYIIDTQGGGFFPGIMKIEHLDQCE